METQEQHFFTEDGRKRAFSQLEFLRTVKRAEVAQHLHDAKESGDVVDNAAYEDAKKEQARLEGRIMELEQLLATAKTISRLTGGVVSLGSVVHLRTADNREYRYTIVGAFEAKPSAGLISNESPVGKALLEHEVGDLVVVSTTRGIKEYTILGIDDNYSPSEKSIQEFSQARDSSASTALLDFPIVMDTQLTSKREPLQQKTKEVGEVRERLLTLRILEDPLTAQNLATVISALTELHTKCWLIQKGRLADLIEYTQTRDPRFENEAKLVVVKLAHNSPAEIKLNVGAKEIAEALGMGIDGVMQAPQRREMARLEAQAKALDLQIKESEAQNTQLVHDQAREIEAQKAELDKREKLLELDKRQLELEVKRLAIQEKRLELEKKRVEYALETASKMIGVLRPNANQEMKELLMRALLPTLLQLGNSQGLELVVLPAPGSDEG